jgi:molybdenum cofactor biosynthesis protein B
VAAVTRVPWPGSGAGQGARSSGAASASGFGAESTMGHEEHRKEGPRAVRVAVITASDTRSEAEDTSGAFLKQAATAAGHEVVHYRVVKDDPAAIRAALEEARQAGAQVLLVNGGTGISPRDGTYEAVTGLLEKRLNGFGELFRMLSWSEIGSAAMLSRAVGGVWRGCALFSMPGSTAEVRLDFEKLIGPELSHLVRELSKGAPGGR